MREPVGRSRSERIQKFEPPAGGGQETFLLPLFGNIAEFLDENFFCEAGWAWHASC